MQQKTIIRSMTEGSIICHLLNFALPFLLANCLQTFYTMVDTFIMGRFVGKIGLAAVSSAGDLISFYTMLAVGFAAAGQVIIAQFVGKDDYESVGRTIGNLITFLTAFAVVLTVFCCLTVDVQLKLINLPAVSVEDGKRYTLVCAVGFIFIFGYNAVSAILRGMGDSLHPLIFVVIASVINLALDLLFVVGFHWSAFGAALATVLGQGFSVIASIVYLYLQREALGFKLYLDSFRPSGKYLLMILHLGVPMAAQYAAIQISVLFISSRINLFGVAASSANGVACKLENVVRIVSNSVGTAGSAMIAQNIAARKIGRVRRIFSSTLLICGVWAVLCAAAVYLFPTQIFSIFNMDTEVLGYAAVYASAGALCYLSNGLRAATNGFINGLGFASLSMVSGLIDGVVARIGFSLLLGYTAGMGILGFWIGSALAGYVPIIIGGIYYLSGRWGAHKLIIQDVE